MNIIKTVHQKDCPLFRILVIILAGITFTTGSVLAQRKRTSNTGVVHGLQNILLVDKGFSRYRILIPSYPTPDEKKAAEVLQEFFHRFRSDAGDFEEFGGEGARVAAGAVEGDGETVGFVTDHLDEMEDRGGAVEDDGLVLEAVNVEDLFLLGDRRQGLVQDAQRFQGRGGGMKLAEAAVDQDQRRHGGGFGLEAAVTAGDAFVPRGGGAVARSEERVVGGKGV